HWSRPIEGLPKTVTISREADGWYVAISSAEAPLHPLAPTGQETGIDLGVESFATLANGQQIVTPASSRKAATGGSPPAGQPAEANGRRAAGQSAAAARPAAARPPLPASPPAAPSLRFWDVIYQEDLRVATMARNHHRAKSISDAGWSALLAILV